MNTAPAPPVSSILFARGVIARLAIWATLRIAVQEGWGGHGAAEKRTWLAGVIVDAFEEKGPTPDDIYVEEMLLQIMDDEFDTVIEDGSGEGVARDIVLLWDETRVGKQDSVLRFEEMADKLKGKKAVVHAAPSGADEEWEDEDVSDDDEEEVPQLIQPPANPTRNEPEVDEDGFTLVKGKGKGRR